MGELSLRVKIGLTIFLPNFASKSGFKTSSKAFQSTSNARIGLPNAWGTRKLFL
jgi:hypothetical protein